ncbi:MAG TPA: insulinase family protein [Hyphomicrobiaceae bacterium]|nr:insulinase family protein [Hyphomicrobiaceae bacterium]
MPIPTRLLLVLLTLLATREPAYAETPFMEMKTPGGLTFHYRFDDRSPYAALHFGWRDGFIDRHKGKEGLATLFHAMVSQAADGEGGHAFSERLADLHARVVFANSWTASYAQVRAPAAQLGEAVIAALDALAKAKPGEPLLKRLRDRARGSEAQSLVRSEVIAERAAMRALLGDHRVTRAYDNARFDRIGAADLDLWRGERLSRAGLLIVASGALPAETYASLIDKAFLPLPERPEPVRVAPAPPKALLRTIVVERPGTQTILLLAAPMMLADVRDGPTLAIASSILGGGSQGRLFKAVRGDLGATYGASASVVTVHKEQRIVLIRASVANDLAKPSLAALRDTYAKWHAEGMTDAEITPARERSITGVKAAWRDISSSSSWLLGLLAEDRLPADMVEHEGRLKAITRESLNLMTRETFPSLDKFLTIIVAPKADGFAADCVIAIDTEVERCRPRH